MQSIIKGILFTVLLGFFTVAVAQETPPAAEQLSPGARIDKHMVKAELLRKAGKHKEALRVMRDSVLALTEKGTSKFKLPDDFRFKYARVALSADSFGVAKKWAKKYIKETEAEKGQPYDDALTLLNEAERQEKIKTMPSYDRLKSVVGGWFRDLFWGTMNAVEKYWTEAIFFGLCAVLLFFLARWLVAKIISAVSKNEKALSIIIPATIGILGLVLAAGYHIDYAANYSTKNVFEERITNRHTQIDTLALKGIQRDIMDLVKSQKDIMDLVGSMQTREVRLDSTIKALRDSVHEHSDRHLRLIKAELSKPDSQPNKQ